MASRRSAQLLRVRSWPRCSIGGVVAALLFAGLSVAAAHDQSWTTSVLLGGASALLVARTLNECAAATAAFLNAVRKIEREEKCDDRA